MCHFETLNLGLGGGIGLTGFTRSSPLMVPMPFLLPGTRLCASGNFLPAPRPGDLLATPTMSSPSPSPPITDRSFLAPETGQSSCGTRWAIASTPLPTRATPSGFHVFASLPILRTPSLSLAAGTSWSRYVCIGIAHLPRGYSHDARNLQVFATSEPGSPGHETTLTPLH
jgi:hypothetical protein